MKPQPSQAFTIPIGDHSLRIPAGALVPDSTFWNAAIEADRLAREGYGEISRREVERLQAFFASFPGEPEAPTQLPARWMLLRVTSRQEGYVIDTLREKGITAYAPTHITPAKHAKRKATRSRPLIPGYVFVDLRDDHSIFLALGLRPVIEIMCRDGKPVRIRPMDIGALVFAEACNAFNETWAPPPIQGKRYSHRWKSGDRVKIQGGSFDGHLGTVLRSHNRNRMELLMTLFGRPFELTVEHKQLTKPENEN